MSYSNSFPTQRPTLNLDFANSGILDSRLSYSRSSGGTYLSNERHKSSENLLRYSNPNNALWVESQNATITTNSVSAPDGSTTASKITEDSTAGVQHRTYISQTVASGQTFTYVGYLKANGRTVVQLSTTGAGASAGVEFDLSGGGTATTRSGSPTNAAITQIGTDWYKCSFQVSSTSSALLYTQIVMCDAANSTVYDGDGTSGVYAWGFSLSTTGETVLNETSGQIHREYAPTLKTSAANEPRFEYTTDGESEGLLIEASATNLQRYGSGFGSWSSLYNVVVTSNAGVGPNGSLDADLVVADSTLADHYVYDNGPTLASGNDYTASVYVKDAGQRYVQMIGSVANFGGSKWATFDLVAGTIDANNVTASMVSVGNGWWRIQATMAATGSTTGNIFIALANNATAPRSSSWTGDDYSGVLLFGYQLETGSSASSLVDTGTGSSQLTRSADSCSVALSDINFVGGEVSLLGEGTSSDQTNYRGMLSLHLDSSNFISLYAHSAYNRRALIKADGVGSELSGGAGTKAGLSVGTNDVSLCVDGGAVTTDASQTLPDLTGATAYVGSWSATSNQINGHIKRLSLYSVALSDTELQALTS